MVLASQDFFMSEKSMQPSRFLLRLISMSMFLFIFSSVFLLLSPCSLLIPRSVLSQIHINNTSIHLRSNSNNNSNKVHNLSSVASLVNTRNPKLRVQDDACQGFDSKEMWELRQGSMNVCDPNRAFLRVFMYDLPPEFHFGLLGWKGKGDQIWPDVNISNNNHIPAYPGGLNLQHSMEYWLTLDLLSSNSPGLIRPCSAVRVKNSSQADIIFVPFFSSLSYNRHSKLYGREKVSMNKILQDKLVKILKSQDEWKRQSGKDHLIVAHHPNSMLDVRRQLGNAMFVLADFGRYPVGVANIEKDIIAPYKHVVRTIGVDSAPFEQRPILMYFQGTIYRKEGGVIRQELYYLLKDEKDVHFAFGSVDRNGIRGAGLGMSSSKFCLNIAGDTPSSNRLFDSIASNCVPVIISDEIELPFENVLDYSEFCIFVRASDAIKKGFLLNLLRGIKHDEWTRMWKRLQKIAHHFEYQHPSQLGDAVEMIWRAVSHKISSIRFRFHRQNRFKRFQQLMGKSN